MKTYPMTNTEESQVRRRVHGSLALGAVSMLGSVALSVSGERGWPCAPLTAACLTYAVSGALSVHHSDRTARRAGRADQSREAMPIPAPIPATGTVIHVEVIRTETARKQVAA
jgi:hypothetical protein